MRVYSMMEPVAPIAPVRRIDQIDILRGIALLGVLAVNLVTEFRVSLFAQFLPAPPSRSSLDTLVMAWLPFLLASKAFILFSFLFGVGLAVQHERASHRGRALPLLIRRLLVLLGIGIVHLTLIWNGDILTEYAVAGFAALPFLFASRSVLVGGAAAFLALYVAIPLLDVPIPFPDPGRLAAHVAEADRIYAGGTSGAILRFEQAELSFVLPLHLFVLPRTIALFLLGALAWRSLPFRDLGRHATALGATAGCALLAGGALTLLDGRPAWLAPLGRFAVLVDDLAPIVLALGYGAAILLLATLQHTRFLVRWAAPLGRMAFTNYLLQSLLFSWLFFGWGMGLYGLGAAPTLALGLGVYLVQVHASAVWLRSFRFGPVEWLWRTLMYGARQPMRR